MNKYRNRHVTIDGITFDSAKEARRYVELKLLEKGGYIKDLRMQVPFELIPNQKKNGKVVERKVIYKADFVYVDAATGENVVEDVKSDATRTQLYVLKKKLMRYVHNIEIKEI